jgi:polar amino acid transport system substrate-binding protein
MKRKLTLLALTVFVATSIFAGCSSKTTTDTSLADIKAKGKFVVGLDDTFAPMGFRDATTNEIVGFDIDLANEAAKRMGVKAEFKPVDWAGVTLSLNNKDIDVIWNGLTITEERKQQINYTKPYIKNSQLIVTLAGSSIKTKADLAGKVVATQLGSSSVDAINADSKTAATFKELKKFDTFTTALAELKAGRADAVVIDALVGNYYMAKEPGVYSTLTENFGEEEMGVGVRKTDETFLAELNKVLDEMKADGTFDKIAEKWFGTTNMIIK